jgi:hypothetical protein
MRGIYIFSAYVEYRPKWQFIIFLNSFFVIFWNIFCNFLKHFLCFSIIIASE